MKPAFLLAPVIAFGAGLASAQDSTSADTPFGAPADTPPEARAAETAAPEGEAAEILARFSGDPDNFTQSSGAELYATSCRACHMEDGKGATGAGNYPPLAGNPKLQSKYFIVTVLLTGYHGMPRFGDQMDDSQIAEVSNYVRSSWGNDYPGAVTPEDVAGLRREWEDSGGH